MEVEFKLFGSLTVRQFIALAGGIVVAVVIYFLGLPIIIGWPLIIFSAGIGFAMAFITVNGQSFSKWMVNFINAMISSQRYVWKKTPHAPQALTKSVNSKRPTTDGGLKKKEFGLTPIVEVAQEKSIQLDTEEQSDLALLDKYFENEFGKTWAKQKPTNQGEPRFMKSSRGVDNQVRPAAGGINRVNPSDVNIASRTNLGQDQVVVDVGQGQKAIYRKFSSQSQRPISKGNLQKDPNVLLIEEKIHEILEEQKLLEPLLKTKEIEQNEKKLKAQMRQLYHEIQQLKNNG